MNSVLKLLLVYVLVFFLPANITTAEKYFYKWVDKEGVTHVTDKPENVPPEQREKIIKYKKGKISLYSKLKLYSTRALNAVIKNRNLIIGLFSALIVLIAALKIKKRLISYFSEKKYENSEKTVLKSGIKKMGEDEFKNMVKSALLKSGYTLRPFDSDFNTLTNFLAVKGRKKYAVHISTDLNHISALKIKNIEEERQGSGLDGSIVIANTKFENGAVEYAQKEGCRTVDEYAIAKAVLKGGKIDKL